MLTLFAALFVDDPPLPPLLASYLPGYEVSLAGAFVGFGWAAFASFVAGRFRAWVRKLVIAPSDALSPPPRLDPGLGLAEGVLVSAP